MALAKSTAYPPTEMGEKAEGRAIGRVHVLFHWRQLSRQSGKPACPLGEDERSVGNVRGQHGRAFPGDRGNSLHVRKFIQPNKLSMEKFKHR